MSSFQHAQSFHGRQTHTAPAANDSFWQESNLWKLTLLAAIAYLVWTDRPLVVFAGSAAATPGESTELSAPSPSFWNILGKSKPAAQPAKAQVTLAPNELDNATFALDPGFAKRNAVAREEVAARTAKCEDYVERFAPVAVAEMRKFGIPASITLAQALLESNAGDSKLVRLANNHFGIKCHAKNCKKGHCVNYTDDTHKDFFVKYANAWGSFRAHSLNLKNKPRYAALFELPANDYKSWACGLVDAGYATDKKYGAKLIALVERLDLKRFDRPQP